MADVAGQCFTGRSRGDQLLALCNAPDRHIRNRDGIVRITKQDSLLVFRQDDDSITKWLGLSAGQGKTHASSIHKAFWSRRGFDNFYVRKWFEAGKIRRRLPVVVV